MRAVAEALHSFISGFGLPAYTPETVPDDVKAPYLIYPLNIPEWDQKASFYIQGWYRTKANADLADMCDRICRAIGVGITLATASGYLVIYPENPLVQTITDGDNRSFYINLSINAYQMPGAYPEPPETAETQEPGETQEEGE